MTMLCKVDDFGYIKVTFESSAFIQQTDALPAPVAEPKTGYAWKLVGSDWVEVEDNRGKTYYDPSVSELTTITLKTLGEEAPVGWLPYGDTQREQEAIQQQWDIVKKLRNLRLAATDWINGSDVPLTAAKKTEWKAYRQKLRDLTDQEDPLNIIWPKKPE